MTNLRARLLASFFATGYNADARAPIDISQLIEFDYGVGANAGDFTYLAKNAAIIAGGTTTLDFGSDVLTDQLGGTIEAASIKAMLIVNTGTVAITLGGTNQGMPAGLSLKAGGACLVTTPTAAGYTRSGGADAGTVTLTNESGATAAAYSLAVLGVLA